MEAHGSSTAGVGMNAVRAERFEPVVRLFFEAAAHPERWPQALHELALACGAEGAAAHTANGTETRTSILSQGVSALYDNFITRWRAPELNSHRARGLALLKRGWRGALTENDIFTPEDMARDPFHQEFIIPSGFSSFAGIVLAKRPGLMMSASIYRRPKQGRYEKSEIKSINKLTEQLRSAAAVAMRIGMSSMVHTADAFASLGQPVAVLSHDGRIVHTSPAFDGLIANGIHIKTGRLGCWQPDADRRLAAAIGRATTYDGTVREPGRSVILPRRNGLRPLIAEIIPVVGDGQDIFRLAGAILTLTDLEAASLGPPEATLQQVFQLTPVEARLAAQIAAGGTLPDIARTEGIARDTLRSRLKSIFDKTGTRRQLELALVLKKLERRAP